MFCSNNATYCLIRNVNERSTSMTFRMQSRTENIYLKATDSGSVSGCYLAALSIEKSTTSLTSK